MKCLVTVALLPVCCSLLAAQALHTTVEGKPAVVRVSDYVSSGGIRWEPVNLDASPDVNPDTPASNPKKKETGVTLTFPVLDVYSPQGVRWLRLFGQVFRVFKWKDYSASCSRGGGNVKIGFIDFQGLVGRGGKQFDRFPRFP